MAESHAHANLSSSSTDSSSASGTNSQNVTVNPITDSQIDRIVENAVAPLPSAPKTDYHYHEGEPILPHDASILQENMSVALANQAVDMETTDETNEDVFAPNGRLPGRKPPEKRLRSLSSSEPEAEEAANNQNSIGSVSDDSDLQPVKDNSDKDVNPENDTKDSSTEDIGFGIFDDIGGAPAAEDPPGGAPVQAPPPTQPANQQRQRQKANRSSRARDRTLTQQPPPTFLQFPVVLQDLGTGTSTFASHVPFTNKTVFRNSNIGPVKSQRLLMSGKFLLGCYDAEQQNRLAAARNLCGIHVKCFIPSNRVEGVIKPVSTRVDINDIINSAPNIISARRLKLKDQTDSKAVRITFNAAVLPDEVYLDPQTYVVQPYSPPVLRCTKCNKLGHTKTKCRAPFRTCPACGERNPTHIPQECPNPKKCVNCQGTHSAAYAGCPEVRTREAAGRIRSKAYIPFTVAITRAREQVTVSRPRQNPPPPPVEPDPYYRQENNGQFRTDYRHDFPSFRPRLSSSPHSPESALPPEINLSNIPQPPRHHQKQPAKAKQLTVSQQNKLDDRTRQTVPNLAPYHSTVWANPIGATANKPQSQINTSRNNRQTQQTHSNNHLQSKPETPKTKKARITEPRSLHTDLAAADNHQASASSNTKSKQYFHDQAQVAKQAHEDELEDRLTNRLFDRLTKRLEQSHHLHKRWEDERQKVYDDVFHHLKEAPRLNETYNEAYDLMLALARPKDIRDKDAYTEVTQQVFALIGTNDRVPIPTDDPNLKALMALVTGENPTTIMEQLKPQN